MKEMQIKNEWSKNLVDFFFEDEKNISICSCEFEIGFDYFYAIYFNIPIISFDLIKIL